MALGAMVAGGLAAAALAPAAAAAGEGLVQLSEDDAQYLALGKFIWDGVPYDYNKDAEPTFVLDPLQTTSDSNQLKGDAHGFFKAWIDGPAKIFPDPQGNRLPLQGSVSVSSILAQPWESLWWSFDGRQYRVTKAAMIPYKIKDDSASPDQRDEQGLVVKHLLIGYMGVDSHGG
jgi:hypothetical protein